MDTKPLERFATWARRELLSLVDAQASIVLASGSVPRTEHPEAVRRLESEIETHGRHHVIDKVAYTWFNRIIALRFMDVRGYTDTGIVSPARGQEYGQPEILSDAKRGNFDPNVIINKRTEEAVLGLIDGTRYSLDAEGEAYSILLTEYCRYWHRSMPFMFEREGDYTELLVPPNLLADGAILSRARKVLTEEVCEDVEVIGWLYQFYISERKDEVFASFNQHKKAGADEIPAATQLFTPHWIVRYLVENSVGRLWMLNKPKSRLVDRMDYYITPVDEETDFLKISGPEELTVIDPACGSGHMLTYAFELLYTIYEEEGYAPLEIPGLILTHNLHGTEIDPRAGSLAAFALTMKAREKQRTWFNRKIKPRICVVEPVSFRPDEINVITAGQDNDCMEEIFLNQFKHADILGSLIRPAAQQTAKLKSMLDKATGDKDILYTDTMDRVYKLVHQAEMLSNQYAVVVANPPYMGSSNMNSTLASFGKKTYPTSWSDLFAMFIERSVSLAARDGRVAMITMQSWMYLTSYEKLRRKLLNAASIDSLVHLGSGAFSTIGGSVVSTCAFVLHAGRATEHPGVYVNVTSSSGEAGKKADYVAALHTDDDRTFHVPSPQFQLVPGAPIAYDLDERKVFTRQNLASRFISGGRLKTHDNAQYVRYWWEVSAIDKNKWRFLHNGGKQVAFYGNDEEVANWSADAQRNYAEHGGLPKKESRGCVGITWTLVGSAAGSFRFRSSEELFSSGSPTILCNSEDEVWGYLAALNSSPAAKLLKAINPTMNTLVSNILSLPTLKSASLEQLTPLAKDSFRLVSERYMSRETSPKFKTCVALRHGMLKSLLRDVAEQQRERAVCNLDTYAQNLTAIDSIVSADWGVSYSPSESNEVPKITAWEEELVRDFVSYAVGCMFGRYSLDKPGTILAHQGATLQDYLSKVPSPTFTPDVDNVIPFVDDGWFEDDVVERFREFLRITFGTEHFEENLRFIEESLGVKTLRDYFITKKGSSKFYDDHVKRYKRRPIYWMFSSPKGSFNALIYMHRYNPSTASTVLTEYLRRYREKLEVALSNAEEAAAGGSAKDHKEADRLRKILLELADYEHNVLYPLVTRQLSIDLDDGVLVNYLRFGHALKNIGLEPNRKKATGWDWPTNKLKPLK